MKRLILFLLLCGLLGSYAAAEGLDIAPYNIPIMRVGDCQSTVTLTDGVHKIEQGGAYHVQGQASGQLVVDSKGSDVYLLLDGVTLSSPDGPAIYIQAASHAYIIAVEGTQSRLLDSPAYALPENVSEPNAAIFSKADLSIGGAGELIVTGQYADGIASKDSLTIEANIVVTAVDDAIRGKDHVAVTGSTLRLNAGGDGIKSTNGEGSNRGWIQLQSSEIAIVSGADGIQAATFFTMDSGTLDITSGGGWDEAHRQQRPGPIPKRDRAKQTSASAAAATAPQSKTDDGESAGSGGKGVKARSIFIAGGRLNISARDDALHAGERIIIDDGVLALLSNDDGIHCDDTLHISGGEVTISDAYEGLEAAHIDVSGGTTQVKAIDDGWNAASKAVTEAAGKQRTYDFSLVISGGKHSVIAGGDALDSNGSILVTGGVTMAASSNEQKEVPLDYPMNCECKITGGIVMLAGAYGSQIQTFSAAENQACLLVKWRDAQTANTPVVIQSKQGDDILSFQVPTTFQAMIVSSPEIQVGGAYRVLTDGEISGVKTVSKASMFFPVTAQKRTAAQADRTPTPTRAPSPTRTPRPTQSPKATTPSPVPATGPSYGMPYASVLETADGSKLNYGLYVPQNAANEILPLIVYLHGGSGKGDDIRKVEGSSLPYMVLSGQLGDVRAYVLYPQCPADEKGWNHLTDEVAALIGQVLKQYSIDPNRVILTGHSMGGTGAWSLACEIPQYFSCAIPMSGSVTLTDKKAAALSTLPIWAFAAANDKVVKAESTVAAMARLQSVSPANRVTIFSEGEHRDVPALAWLNPEIGLLEWAFSQQRRP